MKKIELQDLIGHHQLDGVDFGTLPEDTEANTCIFRLDGIVYRVVEDPDDGWRSSMAEIAILHAYQMRNVFPPCEVIASLGEGRADEGILFMVDAQTKRTVLRVGTGDRSDWYPVYIADFDPTAMAVNSGEQKK